jgi:MFS family permease
MPPQQVVSSSSLTDDTLQEPLLTRENDENRNSLPTTIIIDPDIVLPIPLCCRRTTSNNDDNNNDGTRTGETTTTSTTIRINHNVFFNLIVAVLYGVSSSLWNGTAYAAYLKKLGNDKNGPLGAIEAVSGLASLVTALPIGYIADTVGRSKVIRTGGVLLLVTSVLQIAVLEWVGTNDDSDDTNNNNTTNTTILNNYDDYHHVYYDEEDYDGVVAGGGVGSGTSGLLWLSKWVLGGGGGNVNINESMGDHSASAALWMCGIIMALWGVGDGVVNGPCMALFADSTPEGQRSTYFTYMFVAFTAASACGPLVSIVLFQTLGDDWDLYHLRIVIYVGLVIEIISAVVMMFFDDRKALDETNSDDDNDNDDDDIAITDNNVNCTTTTTTTTGDDVLGRNGRSGDGSDEVFSDEGPNNGEDAPPPSTPSTSSSLRKRQKWVPYIVFSQGLIYAMGSGMTVKFFPLFFKDEVGMSPSQVQIIYVIVPFVMVIASTLCTSLAGPVGFGRVQTMLLFSTLGISMLYAMVFFKSYLDDHPFLLVPVYVLRTALMNASYPIQESILMDFVPKDERARWKSLDSVASASWCGSAALGGWLADKYDYTYTFLITAILQTIGTCVWCLLLPLVPRKEGGNNRGEVDDDPEEEVATEVGGPNLSAVVVSSSTLSQPLLTTTVDDD